MQGCYETAVNRRKLLSTSDLQRIQRKQLAENKISVHGDFWASYPALRHIFTSKNVQKLHWEQI